jgi:hypothetical protein
MPSKKIDYSKTIVYVIMCNDVTINAVYFGYTTRFSQRKYKHKSEFYGNTKNDPFYEIMRANGGWNNWTFYKIGEISGETRDDIQTAYENCCQIFIKSCKRLTISKRVTFGLHLGYTFWDFLIRDDDKTTTNKQPKEEPTKIETDGSNRVTQGYAGWDMSKPPTEKNDNKIYSCECGNQYNYRQGLYRHKKVCNRPPIVTQTSDKSAEMLTHLVLDVVKQNRELCQYNNELTNKLVDAYKTTNNVQMITNNTLNNNSHNTFNLHIFLNEMCKDAMNISDFVDSLELKISDLEMVGQLGFVEGISDIIIRNLKSIDIYKRPVHCSDSKREVMYIKDEDKWEKDDDKKRLRKAIKRVVSKNTTLLPEFKALHPECSKAWSPLSDQFNKLIVEAMGGVGDNDMEKENKIIRKIAREMTINKTLTP